MLALGINPAAAIRNLRWMNKRGWFGKFGYYEAADFTPDVRPSRRQRYALVRSWMVHHQGMSLLAIANFLKSGVVQQWFRRDPRVQATELLLQRRNAGLSPRIDESRAQVFNLSRCCGVGSRSWWRCALVVRHVKRWTAHAKRRLLATSAFISCVVFVFRDSCWGNDFALVDLSTTVQYKVKVKLLGN